MNPTITVPALAATIFFSLSFPVAAASALSPTTLGGETSATEVTATVSSLVESMLSDAEGEVTYECNGECAKGEGAEACPYASSPRVSLATMIAKSPMAMEAFRAEAVSAIRNKARSERQSDALIGVLVDARSPAACAAAEEMHAVAPKRFDSTTLLSFCELGSKPLQEALSSRAKKGKVDVLAAGYLALQGDKAGRKVLAKALKAKAVDSTNALDLLVAAHGLQHLGDEGALKRAELRVHDAALAALDAGALDEARALVVTSYVHGSVTRTSQRGLSTLRKHCSKTTMSFEKKGKLANADQIFEMLQELAPTL